MFTKLNKANGYYAGKSYGTFQTATTKTGGKLITPTTTKTGGGIFTPTIKGSENTENSTRKTEDKTTVQTIKETLTGNGEKSSTLKWGIIIVVIAVGGYFLYKHYKH